MLLIDYSDNLKCINAGGLIQLNHGRAQPLQYAVNFAYLANLYADYLDAVNVPGWYCGPNYFSSSDMRSFAKSQVQFYPILIHKGKNYITNMK